MTEEQPQSWHYEPAPKKLGVYEDVDGQAVVRIDNVTGERVGVTVGLAAHMASTAAWRAQQQAKPCTVEQVAAFNRALQPLVLRVCEQSGVPPTHVALYADFVMTDGTVLRGNLTEPLDAEAPAEEFADENGRNAKPPELIGRTIAAANIRGHSPGYCDSENVLLLTMTDGTIWEVTGGYERNWTGQSCDEYPETVNLWQVLTQPGNAE